MVPIEIVAEISGNHNGSISRAKELIFAAKESGATRVKIQTYTADTITINSKKKEFMISPDHPLWAGQNLYELYSKAFTPWDWHPELFSYASSIGIPIFSTPFDVSAVNFLESLDVDIYKIASLETGDTDLLAAIAATGKPIYASTGASTFEQLKYMHKLLGTHRSGEITYLLCVSSYPAPLSDSNLERLKTLSSYFGGKVGLSDHCLDNRVAVTAAAMGASVIEKHFTLSRKDGGPDAGFSLEPQEFKQLVEDLHVTANILGSSTWMIQESERESLRFRKSLYIVENVKAGEKISRENVRSIRPSGGLEPKEFETVLGKSFKCDVEIGTPLTLDILEQ